MALFFGEILEPTSRAIFEEFSDDEEETKPVELRISWSSKYNPIPEVLDTVFIYCGKLSLVFAEAYVIQNDASPIGEITVIENIEDNSDGADERANYKQKAIPSRIYYENSVLMCLVSPSHSSDLAYQFVNCLTPWLKTAKRVIVFTNESCCNYRTAVLRDLPPAFVRELKTSYSTSDYIVNKLPVPNIVAGVPAAIASWCQIYKKDASLFVCYTDQQKLDSLTAGPYLSVIKKLNPKLIINSNPDLGKKRFFSNPDVIGSSSNIYI